jgi:predicted enzyme related to lactoylglutathione lyase
MTSATKIDKGMITLLVSDMEKAVKFYTEKLGLKLSQRYGDEFAVVTAPGLTIGLHPQPRQPSPQMHSMSIGLGVDSIESAMHDLAARGIKFTSPIVEDPPVRIAHFSGPGGVPLYLVQESGWK